MPFKHTKRTTKSFVWTRSTVWSNKNRADDLERRYIYKSNKLKKAKETLIDEHGKDDQVCQLVQVTMRQIAKKTPTLRGKMDYASQDIG